MFTVILILWGSAAIGYVLRRHPFRAVGRLTTWSVWLLLFLMGCEVGANPDLISQLGTLGLEALILTVASFAGCMGLSWAFWVYLQKHPKNKNTGLPNSLSEASSSPISPKPSIRQQTGESMVIVGFFAFGVSGTRLGWIPVLPPEAGFYALCLLLGCVGFSIGQNDEMRHGLRKIDKRQALLPVVTAIGTWLGAISTALLIQRHTPADWLAAGSGFGYYSLSSILITEMRGAELGTIALMYNIFRELAALIGAPLLYRMFGPLAPISQGGATTGDTTLPIIAGCCGNQFVPLSIFHGFALDFTVPFLVPFFCSLS